MGYLALVLKPPIYDALPNSATFDRHVDPETVTPSNLRLTWAEIAAENIEYDEDKRLCYEVSAVENTLRNQIVNTIELEYVDDLRDLTTDMIVALYQRLLTTCS